MAKIDRGGAPLVLRAEGLTKRLESLRGNVDNLNGVLDGIERTLRAAKTSRDEMVEELKKRLELIAKLEELTPEETEKLVSVSDVEARLTATPGADPDALRSRLHSWVD